MTQDINALIEGLEYFAKEGDAAGVLTIWRQAAQALTDLSAEVERLCTARVDLKQMARVPVLEAERDQALAENVALRAQLAEARADIIIMRERGNVMAEELEYLAECLTISTTNFEGDLQSPRSALNEWRAFLAQHKESE